MPALNFRKQFAELVRSGRKTQTIRTPRKRPIQVGDTLHLYTGQRTASCEKLAIAECTAVQKIELYVVYPFERRVKVDDRLLSAEENEAIAKADGFSSFLDFFGFFFNYDPDREIDGFEGTLIKWKFFEGDDK